ncbi:MAG TPA: hypothetical protein HPP83_08225 [Candidatus Hydrogenedentes bacterium]|nr:hypothetical protein [Candidatus Hydrogenedentota bacterium]
MRHGSSLVAAMEGISRSAFRIAKELARNSRSGLTVRFLSKKLDLPVEEIEYLIDVSPRLMFYDLTKVKLAAEGRSAVKRILEGLENRGDVPALFRRVKALGPHEFRRLEEQIGLVQPGTKRAASEELINRYYARPDSIVEYVATRNFSSVARELFDMVWQSKSGVLPVSRIRAAHPGSEFEVEQGLWELFRGLALFEMFRFDAEDRLVRVVGVLSELRQWFETSRTQKGSKPRLKRRRAAPDSVVDSRGLEFSDQVCRLVAALSAKPARLRGDGELFREAQRRLGEICPETADPSLTTYLWAAQGVGWVARVDNDLRAGELEPLINLDRIGRHRILFDWFTSCRGEAASREILAGLLEHMTSGAWYSITEFVHFASTVNANCERAVLRNAGGHWHYVCPSASDSAQRALARLLSECLLWLGVIDRTECDGESLFRVSELGRCLLTREGTDALVKAFPGRQAEIVVQPNFDIVVPTQDVDPLLTVPLEQFGNRLSTGRATVYHVDKESFTRALQSGHDGNAFVEFLLAHNRNKTLPPNVLLTLEDWRGGMKRVRLRTVHVLETDDPLILADIMHRRKFGKHFQTLDPQRAVRYSGIAKAQLAKELEKDGFIVD